MGMGMGVCVGKAVLRAASGAGAAVGPSRWSGGGGLEVEWVVWGEARWKRGSVGPAGTSRPCGCISSRVGHG